MKPWEAVAILAEVQQEYRKPQPPPDREAWLSIPVDRAVEILRQVLASRTETPPREEESR